MDPDKSIAANVTASRNSGKQAPKKASRGRGRQHEIDPHAHLETADDAGSRSHSGAVRDDRGSVRGRKPRAGLLF
jgi:hypothetical protein